MNLLRVVKAGVESALEKLGMPADGVVVTRSADSAHGDFSTSIAFKIAKDIKQSPLSIAIKIADNVKIPSYVRKLEVKEPGFVNFFIKDDVWQNQVNEVLKEGEKFGANDSGKGKKARVEFVSANPTGPLHFGNARGGPIGDVLASVLGFSGYQTIREYYHNDVGGQVEKLGQSIVNVHAGKRLEDQEYKGEYVKELAKKVYSLQSTVYSPDEAGSKAVEILLDSIITDCEAIGIKFDKVYSESQFIDSGKTKAAIDKLDKKSFLKPKDGAIWFAPDDEFLKDRETVVVKGDDTYTYFANDIAYHELKFGESPDLVIDVLGANHHGHVPRLQAVVKALGYDVSRFHVILYQWVRFKRGGEVVAMSKRSGTFITAREVLDEIGRDAVRFFILMHDSDSPIDFDLDLAKEKSSKNPVYYVQYANARICSILSKVPSNNLRTSERLTTNAKIDYSLLSTDYELNLMKQITKLPELVEDIGKSFAVHHLTGYSVDLADAFHKFYENCKVIGENEDLTHARIGLLMATQIALQNTLRLLGVSAPEKM